MNFGRQRKKIKEKTLMITGDHMCGKTTLLQVLDCNGNDELPTVYFKFLYSANPKKNKKKKVMVSFWDTPAEGWDETREAIYPKLNAVMIVFAVDDARSLENVRGKWYPQVKKSCTRKIPIILVGNKIDMRSDPIHCGNTISYEEGLAEAKKIKAFAYVECSALNKDGTLNVFTNAIQAIVKKNYYFI